MAEGGDTLTIAGLRAAGLRLGMLCTACNRFRYLGLDRYDDEAPVAGIGDSLICSRCHARGLDVRPVARDAATGFWPAEYA